MSQVERIIREKQRIKVCSLSQTYNSHLLWAHYASGFDGLVVEVELPHNSPEVRKVSYRGVFAEVAFDQESDPSAIAEEILSSKYSEWDYEQELRILQTEEWFALGSPVKQVIAGHRMQPALFETMRLVCEKHNISFSRTVIEMDGIHTELVDNHIN